MFGINIKRPQRKMVLNAVYYTFLLYFFLFFPDGSNNLLNIPQSFYQILKHDVLLSDENVINAFDKSVSKASHALFLSRHFFYFSIITGKQCCALLPFQNLHQYLEKNGSENNINRLNINLSKILIAGKMLTGL